VRGREGLKKNAFQCIIERNCQKRTLSLEEQQAGGASGKKLRKKRSTSSPPKSPDFRQGRAGQIGRSESESSPSGGPSERKSKRNPWDGQNEVFNQKAVQTVRLRGLLAKKGKPETWWAGEGAAKGAVALMLSPQKGGDRVADVDNGKQPRKRPGGPGAPMGEPNAIRNPTRRPTPKKEKKKTRTAESQKSVSQARERDRGKLSKTGTPGKGLGSKRNREAQAVPGGKRTHQRLKREDRQEYGKRPGGVTDQRRKMGARTERADPE